MLALLDTSYRVKEVDLTHWEGWSGLRLVVAETWIEFYVKPTNF